MISEAEKSIQVPPRPLMLIEPHYQLTVLESAIQAGLDAGCDVLLATERDGPTLSALTKRERVYSFKLAGKPDRGMTISTALDIGRRMGVTHLVTLDPGNCCDAGELARIVAQSKADPDAVVSAVWRTVCPAAGRVGRWRAVTNFWFRVQTGIRMKDSTSGLRAYPLDVFERLTPRARGAAFDYEVLVRAAWGDATIREVEIRGVPCQARRGRSFLRKAADRAIFGLLNVHLTMRSITPWPHRKIAPKKGRPEEVVSFLHPWRSMKILVGQNTSARQLALAGALGVFLGTLPLIACHSIAILFAAGFFRLNKVAALSASQVCMPPLVPALCIETGYFIRHGEFLTEISLRTLGYEALERVFEWLIGSLILAPTLAVLVGGVIYLMAHQIERRAGLGADSPDPVSRLEN